MTTIAPGRARQARLPSASKLAAYAIGFAPTAAMFAAAGRAPVRLAWAPWALIAAGALAFVIPARRMRLITDADVRFLKDLSSRGWRTAWRPVALTAGVLYLPARALDPQPPPLPGPYPPARPTSAVPLAALGATLLLDGIVVAAPGRRPGGRS